MTSSLSISSPPFSTQPPRKANEEICQRHTKGRYPSDSAVRFLRKHGGCWEINGEISPGKMRGFMILRKFIWN